MAGAQLSQIAMTTTDVALVGRLKGEALATMAVGQAAYGLFLSLGIGLVAAVNPLVSQAYGAKKPEAISKAVSIGIVAALVSSLVAWGFLWRIDLLFNWIGYDPQVATLATGYTRACMWGLPFAFSFLVMKNYLDGVSLPKWPFYVALVGVAVNGIADYLLMFGVEGWIPALGVVGTGLATTTVNGFMALTLLLFSWKKEFTSSFKLLRKAHGKEFLEVGLPIAGSIGLEVGLFVFGALMMGKVGTAETAAHQIVLTLAATTFMIPLGISFAGATRVGQAVGAKDFSAVRPAGLTAILVGTGCMALSAIAFIITPNTFISLFWDPQVGEADAEVVRKYAVQLLIIAGIFQLFDGMQITAAGALRGMKDVKIPLIIGAISYWIVGLGFAYYLTFHTELRHVGLWIGFLLGLMCAGLGMMIRFLLLSSRLESDPTLQSAVTSEAL